ncbi:unnamed protein product [Protopolystoma xenopodis]|uniref:Uncharacterized protein n=1 Tax=Protopolystoma xenopodis TaxID=117903 RepID=A0A448XT77_9PLAT|nr:unnamed protein product [Protopolystoma xenopodis]
MPPRAPRRFADTWIDAVTERGAQNRRKHKKPVSLKSVNSPLTNRDDNLSCPADIEDLDEAEILRARRESAINIADLLTEHDGDSDQIVSVLTRTTTRASTRARNRPGGLG